MSRAMASGLMALAVTMGAAAPVSAQEQILNFNLGYFALRGQDGRGDDDVLNADRCIDVDFLCEPLLFDIGDFNNATIGAEYLFGVSDYIEVGVGIGYYQRTVDSIYEFVTHPDESELEQELKLRVVPITGTVRVVPTGRDSAIQPYAGVGIAALNWRYSEVGDFVDPVDFTIFRASFEADGTEIGPVFLGGVRFVGDSFVVGGEVRYHSAEGDLPEDDFLGQSIDLGGTTFQATFGVRF